MTRRDDLIEPVYLGEVFARLERQEKVVARARVLGLDIDSHRCPCEVCARTSELCTASESSLEMAVIEAEAGSGSA